MGRPTRYREQGAQADPGFDTRLLGYWDHVGFQIEEIAADHWLYMSGRRPFTISADGQHWNYPAPDPDWIYTRTSGAGATLVGSWELTYHADDAEWFEDFRFRRNGTYNVQTTRNGQFFSEMIGEWRTDGGFLILRERRSLVRSDGPGRLAIDTLFGPTLRGTYTVAADGSRWTHTWDSGEVQTYVRAAGPYLED